MTLPLPFLLIELEKPTRGMLLRRSRTTRSRGSGVIEPSLWTRRSGVMRRGGSSRSMKRSGDAAFALC